MQQENPILYDVFSFIYYIEVTVGFWLLKEIVIRDYKNYKKQKGK